MKVALVSPDLLIASRIASLIEQAGAELRRVEDPGEIANPADMDLVLVDWAYREPAWSDIFDSWRSGHGPRGPRIVVFGPHADLTAHAAARKAGVGPMWARSRLLSGLADLLR